MQGQLRRWKVALAGALLGGWLWQAGCVRMFQQNIEVLFAPEANPTLIWNNPLLSLLF